MVRGEQRVGAPRGEGGAVVEEPVVGRVVGGNILQQRQKQTQALQKQHWLGGSAE